MCHVLVIEDDPFAAEDIRATLADSGASSFSFADTESDALACAREMRPEVIVSDVMLAQGLGPEAVRAIHGELGQIPTIFITGTPERCCGCDPQMIIEKPFSPARLETLFRTVAPAAA